MADDWTALPYKEALAYLRSLQPTSERVSLFYGEEASARAFTVAGVYKLDVLQSVLDSLESAIQGDLPLAEFVDRFESLGLAPGHLETIYHTNLQTAYGRGTWEQGTDTEIAGDMWGWRYHTAGDDRVRDEHEALDETVYQTGEADELFPPWDFNCRCNAEWITALEAEEAGLETDKLPGDVRDALADTKFSSPALRDEYAPDLGEYDLGLVREYLTDDQS